MLQTRAKVIKNIEVAPKYYKIWLSSPGVARAAKPGQFLEIRLDNHYEPFLRRPFSIHRVRGANLEILYEVLGKGTEILRRQKSGGFLDIIGPLGNGFNYQEDRLQGQRSILVGGGIGVAPLLFLAEQLIKHNTQYSILNTLVLIGARTKGQIICRKEFQDLGCSVKISTDDGSRGFKGRVTDLLRHLLSTSDYRPSTIYACGPRPMLQEINRISSNLGITAWVSLEEHMACGIGACLGCVVKTRQGFQRVCKDGPIFNATDIVWG